MSEGEPPIDLRAARGELAEIVSSLEAQLAWLELGGTTGLPCASPELTASRFPTPLEALAPLQAEHPQRSGDAPRRAAPPAIDERSGDAPRREAPRLAMDERSLPPGGASRLAPPPELTERVAIAYSAPPLPSPPAHGSPPGPNATWERDRGQSAPLAPSLRAPLTEEALLERRARLEVLEASIRDCARCPLHEHRTQTVFARGNGSSGLCFIGEGPGAEEDRLGEPFVGPAGQLLDKMIASMGLMRDDVYVCNIVKCRPPRNRAPTPEEMRACSPHLAEQLELIAPRVIVALGATAMEGLFGHSLGITRIRGRWRVYKEHIHVMPTFHPAYLLRNPRAKRDVWEDLKAVMKLLTAPASADAP